MVGVERFSLESVFSITDAVSVVNNQSLMKKTPMGQILPTTFISNNDINGSTESHTSTKLEASATYKGGQLKNSVDLNM